MMNINIHCKDASRQMVLMKLFNKNFFDKNLKVKSCFPQCDNSNL